MSCQTNVCQPLTAVGISWLLLFVFPFFLHLFLELKIVRSERSSPEMKLNSDYEIVTLI